jgi:hypothetical protein
VQELHRPPQFDLVRADQDALAAHAAQIGQRIARGKSAAVDDQIGALAGIGLPEGDLHSCLLYLGQHKGERRWRRHVRFLWKIERRREPVVQVGLQVREFAGVDEPMTLRAPREAIEFAAIACRRDDEAAVRFELRIEALPQADAFAAELAQHRRGVLRLAVGCEHHSGIEARTVGERLLACLDEAHAMAGARQDERLPKAEDAGAEHRDGT